MRRSEARTERGAVERARALAERLASDDRPLLLDGATGTELERAGLATGLPLWSTHALLEAPESVLAVHAAHLAAGAEIVTAATFRTQRRTLLRAGLAGQDAALTRLAVELARLAVRARPADVDSMDPAAWIAGSLPPLEDCYRPELVPDEVSLAREHGRQAELLGEAGVDLILVETMNCEREARAAASAAARTGLPFVVSFVAWNGDTLLSGEPLVRAAQTAIEAGAAAVGVNCLPLDNLEPCRAALAAAGLPLLVSPNLGEPDPETGFARAAGTPLERFVDAFEPWLAAGARILGGCCGTTPAHIAALHARLHA